MLIDIGANLAHDSFDDDRDEMMQRAADAGVSTMIVTGSSDDSNVRAAALADESDGVLFSTKQFNPLIKQGLFKGTVSVNLTAHHFYRDHLHEFVCDKLKEYDFPAEHLEIEITEGSVMKNTDEAIKLMHELHDKGVHLSIDDFGTGYSSLSYLKQFPVKSLKIDVSFIKDIDSSDTDKNLVASIISLAHGLDLECVAEGVETIEHAQILNQLNCDTLQGYLFSPAIKFDELLEYLKNGKKFTDYLADN